ncbi:unnamed protein product [Adineta steineri]|uniref:Uncharacterized protein n=1 Tax=Adineta steineri TaxID=433720 RepID=A0A819LNG1_9BILA|nr:unnamed protein product [Adineta steineri]
MSVCLSHINEYSLTCCSSIHDIPSEINTATHSAVSDTCLLLVNNGADRLFLFDLSLLSFKRNDISWPSDTYGLIRDICWAKYINSFLILGEDVLCSYSPISNQLIILLNSPSFNDRFWSLAVLGCDTYILYRCDTLYRYCLPSWALTRSWSRTDLINTENKDQFIEQIRANSFSGIIALLIRLKYNRQWRIDLFDRTMRKLYSGESIRMASTYPTIILQPYGQHGQWTLMNENYIWILNAKARFIERYFRELKEKMIQ